MELLRLFKPNLLRRPSSRKWFQHCVNLNDDVLVVFEFLFELDDEIGDLDIASVFDVYTQICTNSCRYHLFMRRESYCQTHIPTLHRLTQWSVGYA